MQEAQFELHADLEQRHWWFVARRMILRRMLAYFVPPGPNQLVIDVGCGTGANIASLADDYACLGIDTSKQGIELSRKRFPEVSFACGVSPGDLGEQVSRADAMLIMDVLEHVEDDEAMLAAQTNAMKPGGIILITVPANMKLWSQHDESFGHYRRYDTISLRHLWQDLPVKERLVSYFNSRLYPVVRAVRMLSNLRGKSWGRAGTDVSLPLGPVNRALRALFAGEATRLIAMAKDQRRRGFTRGVSLIAVLERQADEAMGERPD